MWIMDGIGGIEIYCFNAFWRFLIRLVAFWEVITFLPVLDSISFRALPAIVPPCLATVLLGQKPLGFLV